MLVPPQPGQKSFSCTGPLPKYTAFKRHLAHFPLFPMAPLDKPVKFW